MSGIFVWIINVQEAKYEKDHSNLIHQRDARICGLLKQRFDGRSSGNDEHHYNNDNNCDPDIHPFSDSVLNRRAP